MSFKRVKVVMLPTNEKAPLWLSKGNTLTLWGKENNNDKLGDNQHLYILSDEEIKVGDWFYADEYSKPEQAKHFDGKLVNGFVVEFCKKIIATTDSSLRIGKLEVGGKIEHLPQISQSFIEIFVEEYNKDNVITEVMIEYKEPYNKLVGSKIGSNIGHFTLTEENKYRLKINANNTINIKPIISTSEEIGEKIVQYCKKYEGTNKYNDVLKAIEFGYQLSLNKDEK